MINTNYPVPCSHKTFQFGNVIIDSNFDSGNLYNAEKNGHNNYNLWIAVDHPKNQYKSWFHFSAKGLKKDSVVTFNLMNFGNQSKLLNEGLVPVFRQQNSKEWKRVIHKISNIEFNEGWIEWNFKHTITNDEKTYFAFFYPWSNHQNNQFLQSIQDKCKSNANIYFKRSNIINSLQGRPVQFITITSKKGITNKNQKFQDQYLFPLKDEPKEFLSEKKIFIIGARVHPGEVPSSHVMTGIISQLTEDSQKVNLLRDKFIFYLFPIINPDGVARGHYRVDPNGINLNRCYINPSPKNHSPIYAIKKVIMHCHNKNKYFGFLDLHAHAARKGVFIYGNSIDELEKQVQICLFPKILSLNSQIFEYQGSNFNQQNMYIKDLHDHVSKEGAGRVALFKMTKNPYSWTLQCNYNMSRVTNIIEQRRESGVKTIKIDQNSLDSDVIINYKAPNTKQGRQFYTINHFRQLGKQICQSLLDLIQSNQQSRIDNPKNYYKCLQNLKLNLAVALLRMAPNRFQSNYKRIYQCIEGPLTTKELSKRGLTALYFLLIKKAKINNISAYLKDNDDSVLQFPLIKTSPSKKLSLSPIKASFATQRVSKRLKNNGSETQTNNHFSPSVSSKISISHDKQQNMKNNEQYANLLRLSKIFNEQNEQNSSQQDQSDATKRQILSSNLINKNNKETLDLKGENLDLKSNNRTLNGMISQQLMKINFKNNFQKMFQKSSEIDYELFNTKKSLHNGDFKRLSSVSINNSIKFYKSNVQQLPILQNSKMKGSSVLNSMIGGLKGSPKKLKNKWDLLVLNSD